MRYLKRFESSNSHYTSQEKLEEYSDDIIKVLSKYSNEFNDSLSHKITELIWSYSGSAADRMEDIGGIDEECIRMLLNDVLGSNLKPINLRPINDVLETYYDCLSHIKSNSDDIIYDMKDIFADYDFNGNYTISRSSDKGDERYIIDIYMNDVLINIDFKEVIDRVKSIIGIENINYSGNQNHIKLEFFRDIEED